MTAPKLTEAQRCYLHQAPKSWRHPSWIPDTVLELEDMGLVLVDRPENDHCRMYLTDAGCAALKDGAR